jgi:membrane protease subunit (stomatin/prohibitin family)
VQVAEPRRMLTSTVGTRGLFTVQDVEAQLRSSIAARIADVIAQRMREQRLSVLDLATEYDELSAMATEGLKGDFATLGLELTRFYINAITVPENLEQRLDQAGGVAALGGLGDYTRFKAAEALSDAAQSGGDSLAGAGVQFGVGANLGALMGQSLAQSLQPQAPAPQAAPAAATVRCAGCGTELPAKAKFCMECGTAVGPRRCASCGHELAAKAKFCIECGAAQK